MDTLPLLFFSNYHLQVFCLICQFVITPKQIRTMLICVHYFQLKVQPNEEPHEEKSVTFSSTSQLSLQSITLDIPLHTGKAMVTSGGTNARTENNNTITHLSQSWEGGG